MLTINPSTQSQAPAGVDPAGSVDQTKKTVSSSSLPPASSKNAAPDTLGLEAISLPPPQTATLSLESLVESVGAKERDNAVKSGVENIEIRGKQRDEENQKLLEKIQENVDKMKSQGVLDKFLSAFKWIGVAIAAVVTAVAIVGVSVGTAGAGAIAAVAVGTVLTGLLISSTIASEVTDGEQSLSQWVSKAFQAMGVSQEIADWLGVGFEILTSVGAAACSGGAAIASSAGKAAVTTLEKTMNLVSRIATITGAVTTTAQGAGQIASSVYGYQIATNQADMKELEAILERIRVANQLDTEHMEEMMEKFNETLGALGELVHETAESLAAVQTGAPSMA